MSEQDIIKGLEPLFNPKSVAVIGATNNWNKWGFSTFSSSLDGFKGPVYPVNIREDKVLGHKAYKKITDIKDPVDLAAFVIPAPYIPAVMEECVEKGVKAGVIIAAGFQEIGEEGKKLQDEVVRAAKKGGIRFVGPNCMGYWSASSNLRAFMFPMPVRPGPIAFVSQGGNVGGAVVMSGHARGIGFHRYISCGATADIQIEEYIEHFGQDPEVKVILTYIEGLNDGRKFMEVAKRVSLKKPIIALKPGKTNAAAKAISSHSGSLSGIDKIYDAVFRECGIIRANTAEELLDYAMGFLTQPLPGGRNVAIITPGGSYGVLCADACAVEGLNVLDLPEKTIEEFNEIFPPRWSHGNPVDPAGDRNFLGYLRAPDMLLNLDIIDAIIFMGFGSFSGFSSMMDSDSSGIGPAGNMFGSMFGSLKGFDKLADQMTTAFESGDPAKIKRLIRPISSMFGSMMGSGRKEDSEEFTNLLTSMIEFSGSGASFLNSFPKMIKSISSGNMEELDIASVFEGLEPFMGSLIIQWILKHKKPVVTTSFTEGAPTLSGGHHAFPSGDTASKVLSKLVYYKEYLEAEGHYKDKEFDPLEFWWVSEYMNKE